MLICSQFKLYTLLLNSYNLFTKGSTSYIFANFNMLLIGELDIKKVSNFSFKYKRLFSIYFFVFGGIFFVFFNLSKSFSFCTICAKFASGIMFIYKYWSTFLILKNVYRKKKLNIIVKPFNFLLHLESKMLSFCSKNSKKKNVFIRLIRS